MSRHSAAAVVRINAALVQRGLPTIKGQKPRTRRHDEDDLHMAVWSLICMRQARDVMVFHPANGGARSAREGARFKRMGVLAGVPDLVCIVKGRTYGLELKRAKTAITAKGTTSPAQREIHAKWVAAGGEYGIARSVTEAQAVLTKWGVLRT